MSVHMQESCFHHVNGRDVESVESQNRFYQHYLHSLSHIPFSLRALYYINTRVALGNS